MALTLNPITGKLDVVIKKASKIINIPAGDISSTNVQSAINELDNEKQALISFQFSFQSIFREFDDWILSGISINSNGQLQLQLL